MKPTKSILDPSFRYVPSFATSVADTWRRFGWNSPSVEPRKSRIVERKLPVLPLRQLALVVETGK